LSITSSSEAAVDVAPVEAALLKLVNEGRPVMDLVVHVGLRSQARGHSKYLSTVGGLNHDGAATRFERGSPDPPESNGAPDDGFTPVWCENVAVARGGDASIVPKLIYDGWVNSPPHYACMQNPVPTVAGLGVYHDGKNWWATLDASHDLTMPDGSAPPAGVTKPSDAGPDPATPPPAPPPPAPPALEVLARNPERAAATRRPSTERDASRAFEAPTGTEALPRAGSQPELWLRVGALLSVAAGLSTAWAAFARPQVGRRFALLRARLA
jgi:hypothetical protein